MQKILIQLSLISLLSLSACVKFKPSEEEAKVQATDTARKYATQILAENLDATLQLSGTPFLLDGEARIENIEKLKAIYQEIFRDKDLTRLKIERMEYISWERLESEDQRLAKALKNEGLNHIHLIAAFISAPDDKEPEGILFFVALDQSNQWRVFGFED